MKIFLHGMQISLALLLLSSFNFQLKAQQEERSNSTQLELKIFENIDETASVRLDYIFKNYPSKILSYKFGETKNKISVLISDKVQPIDILQVLKMNGFTACYLEENKKDYITLEPDGKSTRRIYFKE